MDLQSRTESSSQPPNIEIIFANLGHQVASLDKVRGHSLATDVRDEILLSLTAIQKYLDSKISSVSDQKEEEAMLKTTTDLEMLFRLIDSSDLLVSCCSRQLVKKLTLQTSYQDVLESVLVRQWSEMLLSLHSASAAGILHRIEIISSVLSQRSSCRASTDLKEPGLQTVIRRLMVKQWDVFLRFVFHPHSNEILHLSHHHLYPNIIRSTCSLWMKLIRLEIQKSKESNPTHDKIFFLTDVLLERLYTGSLSHICHRKCLKVLLECLPYSSFLSPLKVVPKVYYELARKNLCVFENSGVDDQGTENREDISKNSRSNWIERCVMRSSISQGFGGFCDSGEGFRDSGVNGESVLSGVGTVDETVLRKLVLLWLRSLAVKAHRGCSDEEEIAICRWLNSLESCVCRLISSNPNNWLMSLFGEQDDDLFEALLCLLDIHILTDKRSPGAIWMRLDPCRLFHCFLESVCSWDHSLLLDLLMSPETCFLVYLTRLLKHITSNWDHWVSVCRNYHIRENALSSDVVPDLCSSDVINRPTLKRIIDYSDSSDSDESDLTASENEIDDAKLYSSKHDISSDNILMVTELSAESQMDVESDYNDAANEKCEESETSVDASLVLDLANEVEENCDVLVDAMTTLIRLRLCLTRLISKDIFPYSVGPLERLLKLCEESYEKVL